MTAPAGALPTSYVPLDRLRLQIEGRHTTALLQGDEHRLESSSNAMWLGSPSMKMRLSELEAIGAVDVDVVRAGSAAVDEPLAVRAEAELVGVDDVAHDALPLAGLG